MVTERRLYKKDHSRGICRDCTNAAPHVIQHGEATVTNWVQSLKYQGNKKRIVARSAYLATFLAAVISEAAPGVTAVDAK